jgi:hypothetical protein
MPVSTKGDAERDQGDSRADCLRSRDAMAVSLDPQDCESRAKAECHDCRSKHVTGSYRQSGLVGREAHPERRSCYPGECENGQVRRPGHSGGDQTGSPDRPRRSPRGPTSPGRPGGCAGSGHGGALSHHLLAVCTS